jgi:cytochrome d ubiquinol oxidase subunit I
LAGAVSKKAHFFTFMVAVGTCISMFWIYLQTVGCKHLKASPLKMALLCRKIGLQLYLTLLFLSICTYGNCSLFSFSFVVAATAASFIKRSSGCFGEKSFSMALWMILFAPLQVLIGDHMV